MHAKQHFCLGQYKLVLQKVMTNGNGTSLHTIAREPPDDLRMQEDLFYASYTTLLIDGNNQVYEGQYALV